MNAWNELKAILADCKARGAEHPTLTDIVELYGIDPRAWMY